MSPGSPSAVSAIILGGSATAVPACRSVGRAGIPVLAIGEAGEPVRDSRHCNRFVEVDGGDGLEQGWLEALTANPLPGVFLPVSDHGVELVVRNKDHLVDLGYTPFEHDRDATLGMLDKGRSYDLAAEAGVATPQNAVAHTVEDLRRASSEFEYPCGLKPLEGHLFRERTGSTEKVIVVADAAQMLAVASPWLAQGLGMMVTEIVPGPEDQIYAFFTHLDERGEPLFEFTNRKLRQYPPHFGVGCYVCDADQDEVRQQGMHLLRSIGYRGFAHVEFKRDPETGVFKFIECNARMSLPIALLIACGIDAPLLGYRRSLGLEVFPMCANRRGLHLWHPIPDIRAARQLRQEGELTTRGWLASLLRRQRFTLFSARDPLPSIKAFWREVKGTVVARLTRSGMRAG